tara:strand:+ start:2241 stop:2375 length:135 start_codon:yes stop_codon:yes gene_type:complete
MDKIEIQEIIKLIRENLKRRNCLLAEPSLIKEEEYVIIEEGKEE